MSEMAIDSDLGFVGRHGGIGGSHSGWDSSSFHYQVRGLQRYNDPNDLFAISILLLRISSRQPGEIQAEQDDVQHAPRNILLANVREG
jgi:hypothetical protein